ncbi:UDP-3-O-(3-hydroxymyristoyl)glucosamine N-acyltransferase [Ignavibacteriales bacterium]
MAVLLKEIADFVSVELTNGHELKIDELLNIEKAGPGSLTFLGSKAYEKFFETTQASAILVSKGFISSRKDLVCLEVDNPYQSFLMILKRFFEYKHELSGIANSASIHPESKLGEGCAIGINVVIGRSCVIGKNVTIFHNSVILENCTIGDNTLIYPNVTIRENSVIGKNVIIHNGVSIGADGFGFVKGPDGNYVKIPQIGNVVIEDFVEIGANSCIDRAALGSTIIKAYSKIDNLVQIGHNVEIGSNTAISAQSGVSGSTKVGKDVIVAGQVGLVDHIEIGDGVIFGAQSGVSRSVKERGIYVGTPVKPINQYKRLEVHIRNLETLNNTVKALQKEITILKKQLESSTP